MELEEMEERDWERGISTARKTWFSVSAAGCRGIFENPAVVVRS